MKDIDPKTATSEEMAKYLDIKGVTPEVLQANQDEIEKRFNAIANAKALTDNEKMCVALLVETFQKTAAALMDKFIDIKFIGETETGRMNVVCLVASQCLSELFTVGQETADALQAKCEAEDAAEKAAEEAKKGSASQ